MRKMTLAALLVVAGCVPLAAQENWCTDQGWNNNGMVTHHEVREQHLAAAAQNEVNPAGNGSIHVHGWSNSDILVKACVQATAHDIGTAESLAKQVTIIDGPGRILAHGPETRNNTWWSVSYDIWVPTSASLDLHASNGSIHVENTLGQIRAHTENGSVHLKDVSGDVEGETTNGSLTIDLAQGTPQGGKGLKLKTVNGSIHVQLPATFGAEVEASTVNGSVNNDFVEMDRDKRQQRTQRFTIGSGGTKIEAETVNGSVKITKQS